MRREIMKCIATKPITSLALLCGCFVAISIGGCRQPPTTLPETSTAVDATGKQLGCQSPVKTIDVQAPSSSDGGFGASVVAKVTCGRAGKQLNDFGESCANIAGCREAIKIAATCTTRYEWTKQHWSIQSVSCDDKVEEVVGSIAR
jgi:hypothetical protein